jgi:hypothetical protein
MELEGSLPCSQEPSTDPYHEPDQSNPHHPIKYIWIEITYEFGGSKISHVFSETHFDLCRER